MSLYCLDWSSNDYEESPYILHDFDDKYTAMFFYMSISSLFTIIILYAQLGSVNGCAKIHC